MTIIRINDPSRLELLLADLRARPDVVAEIIAPDRIRVNILGSYNLDAMRLAILLRVRAWGQRNARAALTLGSTSSTCTAWRPYSPSSVACSATAATCV